MNKPWYFLPFIIVYRVVFYILLLPINIIKTLPKAVKYFFIGIYVLLNVIYTFFMKMCICLYRLFMIFITFFMKICICLYRLFMIFITTISHFFYKWINYIKVGLITLYLIIKIAFTKICNVLFSILKLLFSIVNKLFKHTITGFYSIYVLIKSILVILGYDYISYENKRKYKLYEQKLAKKKEKERKEKLHKEILRQKLEEEILLKEKKQKEEIAAKKIDEEVEASMAEARKNIKKKSLKEQFNELITKIKDSLTGKAVKRKPLVIDFEGEDAVKNDKKVLYEYVAKNREGKIVKDYFEAFSKVEVHSFLLSEGYEVYSIKTNKWITLMHGNVSSNGPKIKTKDLVFFITQLSTYIKAGIPLAEAMDILSRQYKNKSYKKIFSSIIYDLTMGEAFSTALSKQGKAFPKLLINMIKTSEMTGELPEALDDMANYYTEADKTRKQMITALMYPTMVMVFAIGVIAFILIWVIPQFVEIYEAMDASKIPAFTLFVMDVSDFLKNYGLFVLLGIVVLIIILTYLYKNIKSVRTGMQWFAMHMPAFGNVIIYNEVTMFTKTFSSLLKHNVFITDSMEILNKITNNEIYKMLILDTITNIAHGEKISLAFKDHWAFPMPAYEMLVTGEKTGQLPDMMGKVSTYYQDMHAQSVARIKTFIEPVLIIFLTVVVGAIILAIILPMFGMYEMIQ